MLWCQYPIYPVKAMVFGDVNQLLPIVEGSYLYYAFIDNQVSHLKDLLIGGWSSAMFDIQHILGTDIMNYIYEQYYNETAT